MKNFFRILIFFILLNLIFGCAGEQRKPFNFPADYVEGSSMSAFDPNGVLNVIFPSDIFGPQQSGYNFRTHLTPSDEKTISYEVKVPDNFSFVQGGKLPGLCGGYEATGGLKSNGKNGFSVRTMWRANGRLVSYVYHAEQKTKFGDDFQWMTSRGPVLLSRSTWHQIEFRVRLNDSDKKNGTVHVKFDGAEVLNRNDFNFRTGNVFQIDKLCFNAFYGGSDLSWAPKSEQSMQIRNLTVN